MNSNYWYRIALQQYIADPKNSNYNFNLGRFYEDIGQTASAVSFYIRTTEFGNDDLLTYEALLRISLCFQKQTCRVFMLKGILLRAIALFPNRPEAYFLLSRIYEQNKDWQEAYAWAVLGEDKFGKIVTTEDRLKTDVEYPGAYGFTFEKAVAGWWVGLYDESLHLFRCLHKNSSLSPLYVQAVKNNLNSLPNRNVFIQYDESLYERLKYKFPGSFFIQKNFSQSYQDMFVLTIFNGKRCGKYVEIGCAGPGSGNNTTLLEQNFEWSGISLDIDQNCVNEFNSVRVNKAICADATKIEFKVLLKEENYDYLQLDCDPPIVTMEILLRIPFETHKFGVITFEHDYYISPDSRARERSREYLTSQGYILCVSDIGCNKYNSYEDWWVHPDLVDAKIIEKMRDNSDRVKRGDDYMLNR